MNKEFWNLTDRVVELGYDKYENPITMKEFDEAHSNIEKAELNLEKWIELREKMKDIEVWTKENKVPFTALVTFQIRDFLDFLKRDSKSIS